MGVSGVGVGIDDGNILPFPIREQCNDGIDEGADDEMYDTGTKPETLPTREQNNALLANFMMRFTGPGNASGKRVRVLVGFVRTATIVAVQVWWCGPSFAVPLFGR